MKYLGPGIFLLVVVLSIAMATKSKLMWPLGAITITAVLVAVIVTVIAEIRSPKKWED